MSLRDELLERCLTEMQTGCHSAAKCANEHPESAGDLLPILLAAERCMDAPAAAPSEAFRATARTRMLNLIEAQPTRVSARRSLRFPRLSLHLPPSFARFAVAAVAVVILAAGGTGAAAQSAPPNSPLYGAKLALEDLRVMTAINEAQRAEIYLDFAERRLQEIRSLAAGDDMNATAVMNRYQDNVRSAVKAAIDSGAPQSVCTEADLRLAGQQKQLEQSLRSQGSETPHSGVNLSLGLLEQERNILQHHIEGSGGSGRGYGQEHGPAATDQPSATTQASPAASTYTPSPHGYVHSDPETRQNEEHFDGSDETVMPQQQHANPADSGQTQTGSPDHDGQTGMEEHQEPVYTAPAPTVAPAPMPQPTPHDSPSGDGGSHGGDPMEGGGH